MHGQPNFDTTGAVPREDDHDGRAVFERKWYRPYEADARRLAKERGLMLGFVHHPMRANTAGDPEITTQLVQRVAAFLEATGGEKAVYIHCSGGHGVRQQPASCACV